MSDFAVDVRNVSKRFRLAHGQYNTVKERIIHGGRRKIDRGLLGPQRGVAHRARGRDGRHPRPQRLGQVDPAQVHLRRPPAHHGRGRGAGEAGGLLELGAGFQMDLTGRENIYLNGSLLGMTKREVDRAFDAIVDFSELEEFIDGPVKFYSSGMAVRLGFAVAVNVDPDILVIDEVLAVGDERFQRKCLDRVSQFQKEGRTILLVTHSADTGAQHLRPWRRAQPRPSRRRGRARRGDPHLPGAPHGRGRGHGRSSTRRSWPCRRRPDTIGQRLVARYASGRSGSAPSTASSRATTRCPTCAPGDDLTIRVEFEALYPTEDVVFSLEIRDEQENIVMRTDTSIIGMPIDAPLGHERHALRHRRHADARRLLHLRRRDPEPQRHPLRLAGATPGPSR